MATKQKEIYLPVPEYEGMYEVSNLGNIKSLERFILCKNGMVQKIKEKVLKQTNVGNKQAYKGVRLHKDGKGQSFMTHKLVAIVHMGHKPDGHRMVIDHISNDRSDNSVSNLQIVTHRYNASKDRKGSSKYTGVHLIKDSGKYYSKITWKGEIYYLGSFVEEIDAHHAYCKALNNVKRGVIPRVYKKRKYVKS